MHEGEEANQHEFEKEMSELKTQEQDTLDSIADLEQEIADKEQEIETTHVEREKTELEKKETERYIEKIGLHLH